MIYPTDVCLVGASGLVGHELLLLLAHLDQVRSVRAVTRSPLGRIPPKAENIILDFAKMEEHLDIFKAPIFICCLGSTIKKAGSQEAFKKVDLEYVLHFARLAEKAKAQKFLVISAMGADANSKVFYNQIKGEMEKGLRGLQIPQVEIFRPSLILGERKEKRTGEDLAKRFAPLMNKLLVGPLKKYRPIEASDIAKAMAIAVLNFHPGHFIYESDEIQRIADGTYHQQ
ncbi:Rossmann-fold NAD(P)-binding domain-containing protein [Bdellovibrio svalbardensis]|uniref:Oxidoreductase n=1 Tax=Bdellovibrio svalbardensis TaxID=2972972 RepID=A0ABT6DLV1_9BACT|nr:oxidoreductase [Bdellovibrio svalbardensis]MDG0817855.1 oxidoreductase [Bdellovibrio svalbardensis]